MAAFRRGCRHWQGYVLPLILLSAHAWAGDEPPPTKGLTEGVWWAAASEPYDASVIELTETEGGLEGVLHFLKEDKMESELRLFDIRFDPPKLRMRAGAFVMEAEVDLAGGTLEGEAGPPGAPPKKFTAERRTRASIPGLAAWTGKEVYSYRRPPDTGDGWPTATPEEVGLERSALEGIVRDLIAGEGGVMHSILVARDGKLVLEEYFHGYGRDDLHRIASCTKSVASLVVGLAVDQGRISSIDQPVLDFFPAEADSAAPGWRQIQLRHLLTMTAGIDWPRGRPSGPFQDNGPEMYRQLLAREPAHEPGTVWRYANPDVNLLAGVLRQATGKHADDFAAEHLFAPLGISEFDWSTWGKREGYPNLAGSLLLRPRDMAKIGTLVLAEGRWQDRQVVSADWIRAATQVQVAKADGDDDYGYLWWIMDPPRSAPEVGPVIAARGLGSQFIFVAPKDRLIAVTTGGNMSMEMTAAPLRVLDRRYPVKRGRT